MSEDIEEIVIDKDTDRIENVVCRIAETLNQVVNELQRAEKRITELEEINQ